MGRAYASFAAKIVRRRYCFASAATQVSFLSSLVALRYFPYPLAPDIFKAIEVCSRSTACALTLFRYYPPFLTFVFCSAWSIPFEICFFFFVFLQPHLTPFFTRICVFCHSEFNATCIRNKLMLELSVTHFIFASYARQVLFSGFRTRVNHVSGFSSFEQPFPHKRRVLFPRVNQITRGPNP